MDETQAAFDAVRTFEEPAPVAAYLFAAACQSQPSFGKTLRRRLSSVSIGLASPSMPAIPAWP